MAVEEHQQDHSMTGEEDEGSKEDVSPSGFYYRLQTSLAKAADTSKDEQVQQENVDIIEELVSLLSEKYEFSHLTKEEALFYSALLQVQWAQKLGEESSKYDCDDVVKSHLAMTYNSNASSSNVTAFLTYVSLLLAIHYKYVKVEPVENELTLLNFPGNEAQDLVGQWTGLRQKGPLLYTDGRYQMQSVPVAFSREQAAQWGEETILAFDSKRSVSAIREQVREAYNRISGDVTNSQQVWSLYQQFEVTQLPSSPTPDDIELLQSLYFARLRTPHAQFEATLQSYSTFVTKYLPMKDYEGAMVNAHKLVASAREILSSCEPYETQLSPLFTSDESTGYSRWAVWKQYISWITNAYLHPQQKRGAPKVHIYLESACAVYERAIASCGLPPSCSEALLAREGRPLSKKELTSLRVHNESKEARTARKEKEEERLKAEREASLDLWKKYLMFLSSAKASPTITLDVCSRASKVIPSAGLLHAQILRTFCRLRRSKEQIDEYFGKVLSNEGIASSPASIVEFVIAWIDVQREIAAGNLLLKGSANDLSEALGILPLDSESFMDLYSMMTFALNLLEERGVVDEQLMLEQITSEWCIRGGQETSALAEIVWEKAVHVQSTNLLSWLSASHYYRERGIHKKARSLLRQALGKREIASDKKVVVCEELLTLEHIFGGMEEIQWTLQRLESEREKVWNEYYKVYSAVPQSQEQEQPSLAAVEAGPEIDMADGASTGEKRRAVDEGSRQTGNNSFNNRTDKRGREEDGKLQVRDRENSSVMVDLLPADANQEDILSIFKQCGQIREITGPKVVHHPDATNPSSSALVEFISRDSIPTVRSRHHKVIRDCRIEIHLGWECTLYVTNFAPEYDSDEKLRQLFNPFGRIFDIRWPSKKFANSRRFCYVQFCNAQSAQSALRLHDMEMKNGETGEMIKMQVLVSNPLRKNIRSDAQTSDRELFITHLPKHVEDEELKILFGEGVEEVRIMRHADGRNKGVAFIDMKTTIDAQTVLGRSKEDGYHLKGKLLNVSIADKGKSSNSGMPFGTSNLSGIDKRNHQIKVRGLPLDAQEAVIQQIIEAQAGIGTVSRVNWTPGEAGRGVAIVEFHQVAVAGRVALMSSVSYDEFHPLQLGTIESRGAAAPIPSSSSTDKASTAFAPRQAVRGRGRGRGGLGFARRPPHVVQEAQSASRTMDSEMDVDTNGSTPTTRKTQDSFREMLKKGK